MSLPHSKLYVLIASALLLGACSDSGTMEVTPATDIQLQDSGEYSTVGTPGMAVDCKRVIPCRWISADTHFSLTVTNADNTATRSRFAINYSVSTTHDTDVFVSRADDALDADGISLRATDQSLGDGNGSTAQGVTAGTPIEGAMYFDTGTSSDVIENWSIAILDGGMLRTPTFTNLPVGSVTTTKTDCNNTLPCVWETPLNDVVITLQSLGGIAVDNRLTADFSIETTADTSVAVDAGTTASGMDGTALDSRSHTLQSEADYEKLTTETIAGIPIYGSVNFYRTVSVPDSLQQLSLVVYEDKPVPRWNPQFINVPVQ